MDKKDWRKFELKAGEKRQVEELTDIFARHNLSSRELAVILESVQLRKGITLADIPAEPKKIKANPLNADEQKQLIDTAERALGCLRTIRDCSIRDHGDNDYAKMIDSAINIFTKMREQWALAVGHPQEISRDTLMKIVEATIFHMKPIIKQQIADGKF
ncbi:MAG: hypothetical protein J6I40_06180 [Mailhella sp.]|nr:hypothetical protein [Mailhella sp.]